MSTAVHRRPNKLWRSNSIFNLWLNVLTCRRGLAHSLPGAAAGGQTRHIPTRQAFKSAGFQNLLCRLGGPKSRLNISDPERHF
jgi:hypothetical protein